MLKYYKDVNTGRIVYVDDPTVSPYQQQQQGYRDRNTGGLVYLNDPNSVYYQPTQQQQQQQGSDYNYVRTGQDAYKLYGSLNSAGGSAGDAGLAEVSGLGAESAGEMGGSASYMPWGYILAAIQAQHMLSSNTDRRTNANGELSEGSGHRTGDIFSGDFFTEPWMAWGEQQLGVDTPTAGEKTDAAIDRFREGKGSFGDIARTAPETAYQWFDPVGNFAGDYMSDKYGGLGKAITSVFMPHTALKWVGNWLGGLF